VAIVVFVDIVL